MDGFFFAFLMGISGFPAWPARVEVAASAAPAPELARQVASEIVRHATPDLIERPAPPAAAAAAPGRLANDAVVAAKLSRADIADVVTRRLGSIRRCYEAGLREDAAFKGTVEVGWRIQTDGRVASVNLLDGTRGNHAIEGCLRAEILRWKFPASSQPTVVGVYPFVFDAALLSRHAD